MPRDSALQKICPGCGARFQDEIRVLKHMNQPTKSRCRDWFLTHSRFQDLAATTPAIDPDSLGSIPSWNNESYSPSTTGLSPNISHTLVESYSLAGMTYGYGLDFFSIFNSDAYADQRTQYPWYPFASKDEWELASWLSRSRLSMFAINSFLHMQVVRTSSIYIL
jgi:hypothetical protein